MYLKSIIDYASNVCSPYFMYLIDFMENEQRNFTKRLASLLNLNYVECYNKCL